MMKNEKNPDAENPQSHHLEHDVQNEKGLYNTDGKGGSDEGTNSSHPSAEEDSDFEFTFGKFMAILCFSLGYLSDQFVVTMIGATLTQINRDIGPSDSYVWMASGLTTGTAALSPVIGRFGDIYGRRNFILAGNVIGIVGTAVAATAHNVNTVIVGSVIIGIGGAMRQLVWTALPELVPKRYRGPALGILSTMLALAASFGPIIAFSFIADGTWRPVFWFPFGLDCVSLVMTFFWYHPVNQYIHEVGKTTWGQLKETDFIGCILFTAGLVLFLLGLSFGGSKYPWASAGTLAPLLVGIATLICVGFYETYADLKWPIFPPSIFRNVRGFTLILAGVFLYGMSLYATAVLWPTQVQVLYTQSLYPIGWYSGATGFGGLLFSSPIGYALLKLRHARWQVIFYVGALTIISGAQAIVTPTSNVSSTVLAVLLFATVSGVNITTLTFIQVAVPHEFIGIATAVSICARAVGGSVGTVIYTTILTNKLADNLVPDAVIPLAEAGVPLDSIAAVLGALLTGDITNSILASLTPTQLMIAAAGIQEAYAGAFRIVYLSTIAFGAVGLITVCFVSNIDHLVTGKVDIKLQEGAIINANMDTGEGHIIQQNERSA